LHSEEVALVAAAGSRRQADLDFLA
jgi:hypothetical protein